MRHLPCWYALALVVASCLGCGEAADTPAPAPVDAPARTAAGDASLRRMLLDIAAHRGCAALEGAFAPLPEPEVAADRRRRVTGRLWVSRCRLAREGDALGVEVAGRGWQWVDEAGAGPLGSRFDVRGTVRFEVAITLQAEVDVRYDEPSRRAQLLLTPRAAPAVRVTPIGRVPVIAAGGWSGLIGGLGGLLGASPEAQARAQLEAGAARRLAGELGRGLTVTVDLCTSQVDPVLGPLAEGAPPPPPPYPGGRWIDNAAILLHPDGVDVAGPFEVAGTLRVEAERIEGPAPRVAWVCADDASDAAAGFLASGAARVDGAVRTAEVASTVALDVTAAQCDEAALVWIPGPGAARVRYRVSDPTVEAEPLVGCP